MLRKLPWMTTAVLLVAGSLSAADYGLKKGNPGLKSAGPRPAGQPRRLRTFVVLFRQIGHRNRGLTWLSLVSRVLFGSDIRPLANFE